MLFVVIATFSMHYFSILLNCTNLLCIWFCKDETAWHSVKQFSIRFEMSDTKHKAQNKNEESRYGYIQRIILLLQYANNSFMMRTFYVHVRYNERWPIKMAQWWAFGTWTKAMLHLKRYSRVMNNFLTVAPYSDHRRNQTQCAIL